MDSKTKKKLITFLENGQVNEALSFLKLIKVKTGTRTTPQNNSIHLWLTMVAEELDKNGYTLQNVVAAIRRAEIRPTMKNLKESMWRPYQIAAVNKESSTQLDKLEVDRVYEGLNKFLGDNFRIEHIPFPCDEEKQKQNLSSVKMAQISNERHDGYNDDYQEPTI